MGRANVKLLGISKTGVRKKLRITDGEALNYTKRRS
jgi:hypothetical protein